MKWQVYVAYFVHLVHTENNNVEIYEIYFIISLPWKEEQKS